MLFSVCGCRVGERTPSGEGRPVVSPDRTNESLRSVGYLGGEYEKREGDLMQVETILPQVTDDHPAPVTLEGLEQIEPTGIEHANELRSQLIAKVEGIDIQLMDPNKSNEHGNRLSDEDYHIWRKSAVTAQKFARQRLGFLKNWIKQNNTQDPPDHWPRIADALERIASTLERGRSPEEN